MHIAIAGNIGSGKTTLARMLAKTYGWTPYLEPCDNPYLPDYYSNLRRWAFNTQLYFLSHRLREAAEISRRDDIVVQDRTIYEDIHVFARNLHILRLMSDRDFNTYRELFDLLTQDTSHPDLLVYLRASVPNLAASIQNRGRSWEQSISIEYLQGLNDLYEEWVQTYDGRILIIDTDKCRFTSDIEDYKSVTLRIDSQLFGLF